MKTRNFQVVDNIRKKSIKNFCNFYIIIKLYCVIITLCRVFWYFRKGKTRSSTKFYAAACYPTRPRFLLDNVKINRFEVNYRQKTEVITREKSYLTWPHIYLLFFQLNIWSVKCRKTYSIVIQRYKSNLYVSKSN